jgi:flavodoxin
MGKTLVAYFSASGVTKKLAKDLSKAAGADLFEIKPKTPYSRADLDWRDKTSRSSIEMNDPASRPPIAEKLGSMDAYDTVFVGFPIWWYVAPKIINTFLESYDFSGKTLIPFATSGSSGMGKTVDKLRPSCSGSAIWREGKLLKSGVDEKMLAAWIQSLNL